MRRSLSEKWFVCLLLASLPIVALSCNSTGIGILATDSPQLQFGDVVPGQSEAATLTLRNDGGGGVVLDAAAISGDQAASFSVSTVLDGTQLDGGASLEVEVQFSPAALGLHTALLTISGRQGLLSGGGGGGSDAQAMLPVAITLLGTSSSGDDDDSSGGDDDDVGDDDVGDDDAGDDDVGDDDDDTKTPPIHSNEGTRQPRLSAGGGNSDSSQVHLKNSSIQSGGGTSSSVNHRLEGSM